MHEIHLNGHRDYIGFQQPEFQESSHMPVYAETEWPSGRTRYTIGLSETHTVQITQPAAQDNWVLHAVLMNTSGIYSLRYSSDGFLTRARFRATDLILASGSDPAVDRAATANAADIRNSHDAFINIFPRIYAAEQFSHGVRSVHHYNSLENGSWIYAHVFPQFEDIEFITAYSDTHLSISTLFIPDGILRIEMMPLNLSLKNTRKLAYSPALLVKTGREIAGLHDHP